MPQFFIIAVKFQFPTQTLLFSLAFPSPWGASHSVCLCLAMTSLAFIKWLFVCLLLRHLVPKFHHHRGLFLNSSAFLLCCIFSGQKKEILPHPCASVRAANRGTKLFPLGRHRIFLLKLPRSIKFMVFLFQGGKK